MFSKFTEIGIIKFIVNLYLSYYPLIVTIRLIFSNLPPIIGHLIKLENFLHEGKNFLNTKFSMILKTTMPDILYFIP